MLYRFIWSQLSYAFRVYFRNYYFSGKEHLPKKGPVLVSVNHPTAFTDPIILQGNYWRSFYSILKGNMFSSPLIIRLLEGIRCIPIFRQRDGVSFKRMRQNATTMDIINELFEKGHVIQIMSEGVRKHEKRLRPLQKGFARMAFNYYKKTGRDDLIIIPTAITYENADKFRSECHISMTTPLHLKDYVELYKENEAKAVNKLKNDTAKIMQANMVHIKKEEDDELVEQLLLMNRNNGKAPNLPLIQKSIEPLKRQISITNIVNEMPEGEKHKLKKEVNNYFQKLKNLGVIDHGVAKPKYASFWNTLKIIIGFIPAIIGLIFNCLPFLLAKKVADDKTDNIESHASVQFAVGMISYTFYMIFWTIAAIIIWNKFLFAWLILMPALGWIYLMHRELAERWKWAKGFLKLAKNEQTDLIEMRAMILKKVGA